MRFIGRTRFDQGETVVDLSVLVDQGSTGNFRGVCGQHKINMKISNGARQCFSTHTLAELFNSALYSVVCTEAITY